MEKEVTKGHAKEDRPDNGGEMTKCLTLGSHTVCRYMRDSLLQSKAWVEVSVCNRQLN